MLERSLIVAFVALTACGGEEPAAPAEQPAAPAAPAPAPAEPATPAPAPSAAPDLAAMSEEERKAWLMKTGENVYTTGGSGGVACVTCHMAGGEGVAGAFPPLKGAGESMGDCVKHAGYVVHGLMGPIKVLGVEYNGNMPAQGNLSNEEIAAVISYERMSWGNDYGLCTPEQVAQARTAPPPKP